MILRKPRKSIAIFLLFCFLFQIAAPVVSFALTGGPESPEFSSFEPVDTTDMVNLASGDFVYNTPILEVPGPEGGYPLSLSYHAGIKLDQEASWVGLGFTLNPGAVNRSVNGFPDDNANSKKEVRDYWNGGEQKTKTYSIGLTIPETGIGISYNLARTNDTYKGFSSNSFLGVNLQVGPLPNFSVGFTIGSQGTALTVGGSSLATQTVNNAAGKITSYTTELNSMFVPIGKFGSIGLKNFYTRYWSDESQALTNFGTLYPALANEQIDTDGYVNGVNSEFKTSSFDVYDIYDGSPEDVNVESNESEYTDPARQLGGTLPAYDFYEVLGQGIGGAIQPFIFENGDLFGQSIYERNPITGNPVRSYPNVGYKTLRKFSSKKVDFRFVNDFSNSLTIDPATIQGSGTDLNVSEHVKHTVAEGFNDQGPNQKLAGSKHVEWFTTEEIANGTAFQKGFIDTYKNKTDRKISFQIYDNYLQPEASVPFSSLMESGVGQGTFISDNYLGTDLYRAEIVKAPTLFRSLKPRLVDLKKKIGGFMITNESGVTYHYALPVYNYNEYTKSKLLNPKKGTPTFREYKNDEPYASTWLLTAITGPDYVDKDNDGLISQQDLGYWVKFDYGRWADAYQWRTPQTGFMSDIESDYATFSYGIKELYYLDAIETRTHKAIFIKSKRKDGRGVTSRLEGGSNPRYYQMHYKNAQKQEFANLIFNVSPVSTMKLDAIYLFDKSTLDKLSLSKESGSKYREATSSTPYNYHYNVKSDGVGIAESYDNLEDKVDGVIVKYHNGDLVYDDGDIQNFSEIKSNALRIVEFSTDYTLSKGVSNSFGYYSDMVSTPGLYPCSSADLICYNQGLNFDFEWINVVGGPGAPACCDYKDNEGKLYGSYTADKNTFYSPSPVLKFIYNASNLPDYLGENLQYYRTGKLTLKRLVFLGKGGADLLPPTTFVYNTSKNPDYANGMYDEWGFYKSDFNVSVANHTRRITPTSAASTDAWSLKKIITPLGATIEMEYEPNSYRKSVYNDFSVFSIESLHPEGSGTLLKIKFKEKNLTLGKWFTMGDQISVNAFIAVDHYVPELQTSTLSNYLFTGKPEDTVTEIGSDYIVVDSHELRDLFGSSPFSWMVYTPYFISGFIKADDDAADKYAGGVRIKTITLSNGSETNATSYEYLTPAALSSGVTSFKPYLMPSVLFSPSLALIDDIEAKIASGQGYIGGEKTKLLQLQAFRNSLLRTISTALEDVLIYTREAPSPGSVYEYVTTRSKTNGVPHETRTTHHFKVFDSELLKRQIVSYSTPQVFMRSVAVKNYASDVGSILDIVNYNSQNKAVTSTYYGYLFDNQTDPFETLIQNKNQGVVYQSFHKHITLHRYKIDAVINPPIAVIVGKSAFNVTADEIYARDKALVTTRESRANPLTSVKEIDHTRSISMVKQNQSFDFYTGQVTKQSNTDSYGNTFITETIPAYQVKDQANQKVYGNMGLKVHQLANKHMLTQEGVAITYKVNALAQPTGLVSAATQTWSNLVSILNNEAQSQSNIWRKQSTYQWNGQLALNTDGTYPQSDFNSHGFDWLNPGAASNSSWEKTGETTLYDLYSHALEAKDMNGNYSSSRMDFKHEKMIASTANAKYVETAYSGAEFSSANAGDEGDVNRGSGSPSIARSHTGNYSLLVNTNASGFNYSIQAPADLTKKYRASVWLYVPGEGESQIELNKVQLVSIVNGVEKIISATAQKNKSKSWYLLNLDIDPQGQEIQILCRNNSSRGAYFDDFRVHPIDASMNSYVYDPITSELTYNLDANNLYTKFEYDGMGKLVKSSKELLNFDFGQGKESYRADKILNEVKYNYGKK